MPVDPICPQPPACFATGNASYPSALLPGQKQVWSHAWCRSGSTANFDDRTQEEHSSLPSPSNLHSMHANLHQMVSSSRKSRRQYVSLRGTMSRSPRCSFSCRSATWICEEGKVSGVRQRCIWCLEYSTRLHAKIAAFHSSSSGSHASSKTGGHHHITETSLTADTSEVPRSNCCSDTASGSG